jgi:hypothetical protein
MHGCISRALLTTAAAAAAATAPGLTTTAASAAAAVPARGLTQPIFTTQQAGYRAGFATGWRFRWITTTFTVPACSADFGHGWTGNGAELGASSATVNAQIGGGCDPGGMTPGATFAFVVTRNGTVTGPVQLPTMPAAGDSVTVSIFYDQVKGVLKFTLADNTSGDTDVRNVTVGTGVDYFGAEAGSQFAGTVTPPAADFRTGAFSGTNLTSYNVRRGTLLGPWPTSQVIATSTGTPAGTLIASAPVLFNGGASFGVWQRA